MPGVPEPGEPAPPPGAAPDPAPPPERAVDGTPDEPEPGWVILPGINYTPERGLTLAGAVLRYFRFGDAPQGRVSSMALRTGISFAGRGELTFDPSVWAAGDRINIAGTLGVSYFDYPYYGIGNDTPESNREDYTALRISSRIEVVARVWRSLLAGVVHDFRHEDVTEVEEGGLIDAGVVGGSGGRLSGVGGILRWDSRDHSFQPRRGGVVTLTPRLYRKGIGSDLDFGRVLIDGSWFFGLGGAHVLGLDGRLDMRTGDPPFDHLSLAGGSRLLRGMIEGRFRDNHMAGGQLEYRFPLVWRFGGAAFAGAGRVARRLADLDLEGWKWAAGGGLRFAVNPEERINLRFDVGATREGTNFYLAIGEAF